MSPVAHWPSTSSAMPTPLSLMLPFALQRPQSRKAQAQYWTLLGSVASSWLTISLVTGNGRSTRPDGAAEQSRGIGTSMLNGHRAAGAVGKVHLDDARDRLAVGIEADLGERAVVAERQRSAPGSRCQSVWLPSGRAEAHDAGADAGSGPHHHGIAVLILTEAVVRALHDDLIAELARRDRAGASGSAAQDRSARN